MLDVLGAEAGVDEDDAVAALDRQAMADQPRPVEQTALALQEARSVRAQRPTVDVVDPYLAGWGHGPILIQSRGPPGIPLTPRRDPPRPPVSASTPSRRRSGAPGWAGPIRPARGPDPRRPSR